MNSRTILLSVFTLFSLLQAADWPTFRGPNHDGVSSETGWKVWGADGPKIAWKANVGIGVSNVVVAGENAVTLGNKNGEDVVVCFDPASGKEKWSFKYPSEFSKRQFDGGSATTPVIDGDMVYTLSELGTIHCLKLSDGSVVWKKNASEFGGQLPRWHYSSSPIILGDLLILNIGGESASTLALNKTTGDKVWGQGNQVAGYGTPVPFKLDGKDVMIVAKAKNYVVHEVASGAKVLSFPWKVSYDVTSCTPAIIGNQVMVTAGYGNGRSTLFELAGGQAKEVWTHGDYAAKYSSPTIFEGKAFGISGEKRSQGRGVLHCIDLKSGKTVWHKTGFGNGTLSVADGKILALAEGGELVIFDPAGKELARAQVLGGRSWIPPVLSHGRIYCKNNQGQLVCLEVK